MPVRGITQKLNVMSICTYAQRGDFEKCAKESFDCVSCGICSTRCPAGISHPMVGLLARRLTGKYIAPESEHLEKRVDEIRHGEYDQLIEQIMETPIDQMKELYNNRDIRNKGRDEVMYTEEMLESIKKVEASRASRIGKELRRMDADEKDNLLKEFHPDYKESGFATLEMGPNKGEKAPAELAELLQANSRVLGKDIDLTHPDYDVDVLVIGGGGAGASAAIEAHNGGANVMIVTKLRVVMQTP